MEYLNYYNSIVKEFQKQNGFTKLESLNSKIIWPNSSGVYTIWKKEVSGTNTLIYIGMTGKYSRNKQGKVNFNNASFKSRVKRWTPYRFCENDKDREMKFYFRYTPKETITSKQAVIKFDTDAYQNSIPYSSLEIHCFHINEEHQIYTPTLFETLLLTKYLKTYGSLPPANNSL